MTKVIRPAESGPVEAVIRGDPSEKKTEGGRWVGPGALSRPSMTGIQKGGTGGRGYLVWIGVNLVTNICAAGFTVTRVDIRLHAREASAFSIRRPLRWQTCFVIETRKSCGV